MKQTTTAAQATPEARKPVAKMTKPELVAEVNRLTPANKDGKALAYCGIGLMAGMSMGLNGYANSLHATVELAGWAMGIAIPAIVLIIARLAGMKFKAGQLTTAKVGAGVIAALLLLSVWHCATSIALLTSGEITLTSLLLAVPLAIAIDAGLVWCEWCTLN